MLVKNTIGRFEGYFKFKNVNYGKDQSIWECVLLSNKLI